MSDPKAIGRGLIIDEYERVSCVAAADPSDENLMRLKNALCKLALLDGEHPCGESVAVDVELLRAKKLI